MRLEIDVHIDGALLVILEQIAMELGLPAEQLAREALERGVIKQIRS